MRHALILLIRFGLDRLRLSGFRVVREEPSRLLKGELLVWSVLVVALRCGILQGWVLHGVGEYGIGVHGIGVDLLLQRTSIIYCHLLEGGRWRHMHLIHEALRVHNTLIRPLGFIVGATERTLWWLWWWMCLLVGWAGTNLTAEFMLLRLNGLVFIEIILLIIHHVWLLLLRGSLHVTVRVSLERWSLVLHRWCRVTSILKDFLPN